MLFLSLIRKSYFICWPVLLALQYADAFRDAFGCGLKDVIDFIG